MISSFSVYVWLHHNLNIYKYNFYSNFLIVFAIYAITHNFLPWRFVHRHYILSLNRLSV